MFDASQSTNGLAVAMARYRPNATMPAHRDGVSRLSIVVAGRVSERVGSRDEYASAGSLAFKPGDVVHRNVFGPEGAQLLSIVLPEGILDAAAAAALRQWRWHHGGPLALPAMRLWMALRQSSDTAQLADRAIELVAATSDSGERLRRRPPPAWLARVRQQLQDEGPRQGGRLARLAADAGVHPVYLARLFRRHFGCSITDFAQALRLTAAVERLAASAEPLDWIALECGFADQSHLTRSCRRSLGLTPRGCRRLLASVGCGTFPARQ